MQPRNYTGHGPDPYSDDHPRGEWNRTVREKARTAHQLYETQSLSAAPAAAAEPQSSLPVSDATTEQLADAIADAIARREQQPTQAEVMREKSRQLVQLVRQRDARQFERARGAQNGQ
jgi:hypothetical protein